MTDFILHAFVVRANETLAFLSLTDAYELEVVESSGDGFEVRLEHADSRKTDANALVPLPIDSLSVVYGVNGGGKTRLLLDLCRTLGREWNEQPHGILWERNGDLYFDPGSHLRRVYFGGNIQVLPAPLPAGSSSFGTVFYTTSPFESARRRRALIECDTLDATPSFNSDNPFNGVSLFRAAKGLPADLPFLQKTEVRPRLKIPSLRSLVEEYTAILVRRSLPSEHKYTELPHEARAAIRRLPEQLSRPVSEILAIEMHRTRLEGQKEASELLRQLADALQGSKSHHDSVVDFLNMRALSQNVPSAFLIYHAIQAARESSASGLSRRGPFFEYVEDAAKWSRDTVECLQIAESLGLLKWSFLRLSSGQVAMLMLFASLATALDQLTAARKRHVFLSVDEGEMFMHPAWQRVYLSHLMNFLGFYRDRFASIHLVLSTHSLIVAGDAPPYRLFDVVSGTMRNGFAARPEELLKAVYHVPEFAGEFVDTLYAKIGDYLRAGGSDEHAHRIQALVSQIASKHLRRYLEDEVDRRMGSHRAED